MVLAERDHWERRQVQKQTQADTTFQYTIKVASQISKWRETWDNILRK